MSVVLLIDGQSNCIYMPKTQASWYSMLFCQLNFSFIMSGNRLSVGKFVFSVKVPIAAVVRNLKYVIGPPRRVTVCIALASICEQLI